MQSPGNLTYTVRDSKLPEEGWPPANTLCHAHSHDPLCPRGFRVFSLWSFGSRQHVAARRGKVEPSRSPHRCRKQSEQVSTTHSDFLLKRLKHLKGGFRRYFTSIFLHEVGLEAVPEKPDFTAVETEAEQG